MTETGSVFARIFESCGHGRSLDSGRSCFIGCDERLWLYDHHHGPGRSEPPRILVLHARTHRRHEIMVEAV